MKLNKIIVIAGATALISGSAMAQVTKQGNKYLFRVKYAKGQVIKYGMNMSINMGGKSQPMNMDVTSKVLNVDAKGVSTLEVTSSMGGGTQTVKIDSKGKVVGGSSGGANFATAMPDKAIGVGESWTGDMAGGAGMGMNAKVKYTLKGVKTVGGKPCAEISISLTMKGSGGTGAQAGAMNATGAGSMYVIMSDGTLQSSSLSMKMNMSGAAAAQGKNATMVVSMNRK